MYIIYKNCLCILHNNWCTPRDRPHCLLLYLWEIWEKYVYGTPIGDKNGLQKCQTNDKKIGY